MNQLTANPPKRAKKKELPFEPLVMVGECVFAVKGKVSFVKANNLPAQRKFAEILLSETLKPTHPKNVRSLGITKVKGRKNGVYINDTDPIRNDINRVVYSAIMETGVSDLKSESSCCHCSHLDLKQMMIGLDWDVRNYPKAGILALLEHNESTHLPTKEDAPRYLDMLEKFAEKHEVAIIIIWNQFWGGLPQGKNGPYSGKAFTRAFAVAKFSYDGGARHYQLESVRAAKGQDFWPISLQFDASDEVIFHRGIDNNRVPTVNRIF